MQDFNLKRLTSFAINWVVQPLSIGVVTAEGAYLFYIMLSVIFPK
jgi:hypothetical protein